MLKIRPPPPSPAERPVPRVGDEILQLFQHGGIKVAVHDALVQGGLEVQILVLLQLAMAIDLKLLAFGAEGDEHRQGAEIVNVMIDRFYAEGTQVRDDHAAVEGADVQQGLGEPTEIVHDADDGKDKFQHEPGQPLAFVGKFLGAVILLAGLDLVDGLVHLAVDIVYRVRGLKADLDHGFRGVDGKTSFHRHDDFNIVAGVDTVAAYEPVEPGKQSDAADIRGDEHMQETEPLEACHTLRAQPAVSFGNLSGIGIEDVRVVAGGHDKGDKRAEARKGVEKAAFLAVAETAFIGSAHIVSLQ